MEQKFNALKNELDENLSQHLSDTSKSLKDLEYQVISKIESVIIPRVKNEIKA